MKNMKIAVKLISSFLIVVVLAVIVGGAGILGMSRINTGDNDLYEFNVLAIDSIGRAKDNLSLQRMYVRNIVIYDATSDTYIASVKAMADLETEMQQHLAHYQDTITDDADQATFDQFKNLYNISFAETKKAAIAAGSVNDSEEAQKALDHGFADAAAMNKILTDSMTYNSAEAKKTVDGNTSIFVSSALIEAAFLLVAIIAAVYLAVHIAGLISKPIRKMVAAANAIAVGDMEVDATYNSRDEVGIMANAFTKMIQGINEQVNTVQALAEGDLTCEARPRSDKDVMGKALEKLVDSLNGMFSEINQATSQVSTGSKQIADGSQSLAQGSTQQAAAVEQLSSSINEIANKTQANAEMATKAASLSGTIKNNAQKGSSQMSQMMDAVREINEASQSINKVIKVIDDIAFQKHKLALNAAVEAARAGQHGKGFAVVAEEVRSLAAKSASAAKDTGSLIENSMEKAELGARIASETAASLAEIVLGINESTEIIRDIAKSSDEQAAGIRQINTGIDQVAQVVQQNSATAEESAAASEEMSSQSNMLDELVSHFKLKNSGSAARISSLSSRKQISMPKKSAISFSSGDFGKF